MAFPQTRRELRNAYYKFTGFGSCTGCGAAIEWWLTTNGRKMPFDAGVPEDLAMVPHWSTCPASIQFRRPAAKGAQTR